jgi:hypothetical protein
MQTAGHQLVIPGQSYTRTDKLMICAKMLVLEKMREWARYHVSNSSWVSVSLADASHVLLGQ